MEGIFIYWFGWALWVIITFFWSKSKARFWTALSLLSLFILLPTTMEIANISFHFVYFLLSIYVFWQMSNEKKFNLAHSFVASITIGAAFAGFQMLLIYDPVVAYIDSRWMTGLLVAVIAFFLTASFKHRLLIAVGGLIQGELLTGLVSQHHLKMEYVIGSLLFF
ncbi:hypothetical protein JCM9140_1068 [Halalkalibacter wakoensis JCM 9140]|uniref:Uncharacterized protein n=1 Tax=Halalkalibacter wakoensis JCM 9140 TaxID=1236970 RepID=W4PZD0_9BACI|nr:hypothetical protein [Halalkalibacter wakoensis]GAE25097.1 hypothetical protein JCM9140_1068 [Halalkalibacter wakoensis JCM 9140]